MALYFEYLVDEYQIDNVDSYNAIGLKLGANGRIFLIIIVG